MLGWLYRVLIGRFSQCEHKWEVYARISVYEPDTHPKDDSKLPTEHKVALRCTKCGNIKGKRI